MKKVQIVEKSCHREGLKVEKMRNFFRENGYELVNDGTGLDPTNKYAFPLEDLVISPEADLFVLTTCGFSKSIEDGDFDALKMIMKYKKPSAKVIVGGCIVKIAKERLDEEFDGERFDAKSYNLLDEFVEHKVSFDEIKDGNVMNFTDNYFIKIQDGCNHRCSYCAIWKAAGKSTSKPIAEVIEEFNYGLRQGFKHIYFLGECMGAYGLDFGSNFAELLEEIDKIEGDYDLLIEDISPIYFLRNYEAIKKLCIKGVIRSLHVPIQSGCDRILKLMMRTGDMALVKEKMQELKNAAPNTTLSSAVIVGFPTETVEEFQETLEYCKDSCFDTVACHVFSARDGAPAAEMDGQVDEEEKYRRYTEFKEKFVGITRVDPNQRKYVGE
ncbi:radical SAM protein [Clostridium cellulovorans]|uniref:Radical SAM domain protein n=1 Tax=Clostridium cellulovorans (strain ATCC 35296 / DSM 3052 / OCM 3 / 743B) TaxID=573061 RepID=D9STT3_CLOC7|nr:radical SAM protein [Clostridium cellulovorans]ADL52817.1 Radical SAM domain protein [Clostridium cellulovorans 743B]